jgi:GDPmannose 4,6-dehydratase
MPKALITGITGQDGAYLTRFLLAKGYVVHGLIRRASTFNTERIDSIYRDPHEAGASLFLHYGDLADGTVLRSVLERCEPDEIYNLGAQSHVLVSFQEPEYTADIVGTGTLRLLEALRHYLRVSGSTVRFYQASSSEMFGSAPPPQNETTPFHPRSPYGVSKLAGHWHAVNYREAYGMFTASGILFNHESPLRGETFVTRKITRALGRIRMGLQEKLYLGNLEARRDWGFAGDYVEAMWLMLQQPEPQDYVIATGESRSVREFLEEAAACAGVDWKRCVEEDRRYLRPAEVDNLRGDAQRARAQLGWQPKVRFGELVRMMVEHDLDLARQERTLREAGHAVMPRGAAYG